MPKRIFSLFLISALFFITFAGSCDQTVLTGIIICKPQSVRVNETARLALEVATRFEGAYRIMWKSIPTDNVELKWREWDPYYKRSKENNEDRIAEFSASKTGSYEVQAYGFFKQTNPQFIAKITISVTE